VRNSHLMKETLIVLNNKSNIAHVSHYFNIFSTIKPVLFISNHRDIRAIKSFNFD
jgi:hypothetical protein